MMYIYFKTYTYYWDGVYLTKDNKNVTWNCYLILGKTNGIYDTVEYSTDDEYIGK